jgi:pyruvyltransferase
MYPRKKPISLYCYNPSSQQNFDDQLNVDLLERLTGRTVSFAREQLATHICIGSLLELLLERKSLPQQVDNPISVWGTGFIAREGEHPVIKDEATGGFIRPVQIHAVRGAFTLNRLRNMGVDVSKAVLGDPGLLAKLLIPQKNVGKKWRLGLVPHYVDSEEPIFQKLCKRFPL